MANASSSVPAHTIVFSSKFVFSLRILDPKYQNVFLNLLRRVLITLIQLVLVCRKPIFTHKITYTNSYKRLIEKSVNISDNSFRVKTDCSTVCPWYEEGYL